MELLVPLFVLADAVLVVDVEALRVLADWLSSSSPTDRLRLLEEGGANEFGEGFVGVTDLCWAPLGAGGVRLLCRRFLGGGGGSNGEAGSFGAKRWVGGSTSKGRRGKSLGNLGSMKVVVLAVWSMKKVLPFLSFLLSQPGGRSLSRTENILTKATKSLLCW